MKKFAIVLTLLICSGCGNLSPRDNLSPRQQIENQGIIDKIEQNQQLLKSEIDKIALINKENNNSGVQILQGEGSLIFIFGLVTVFLVLFYFYRSAEGYRKTAEILAEQVARAQDDRLEESICKAAEYTDQEERILALLHRKKQTARSKKQKNQ